MQVDFYQLAGTPIEAVVPLLATKVVESGQRLLITAETEHLRKLLDEALWTHDPTSFLPHGQRSEGAPENQSVLLSDAVEAVNEAKFVMLADGAWRDEALNFERVFYLFDADHLGDARNAWRLLSDKADVEPRYWKQDNGKWRRGP